MPFLPPWLCHAEEFSSSHVYRALYIYFIYVIIYLSIINLSILYLSTIYVKYIYILNFCFPYLKEAFISRDYDLNFFLLAPSTESAPDIYLLSKGTHAHVNKPWFQGPCEWMTFCEKIKFGSYFCVADEDLKLANLTVRASAEGGGRCSSY